MIPIEKLFGNPTFAMPSISPDGKTLLYLAPLDGVMNAWTRPVAGGEPRPLTFEKRRGVTMAFWAHNGGQVLVLRDTDGDEKDHVWAYPAGGGAATDLTPFPGAKAGVSGRHVDFPDEILVAVNDRDPRHFDVWRVHTRTGARTLEFRNDFGGNHAVADHLLRVRLARVMTPGGGAVVRHRADASAPWTDLLAVDPADALHGGPVGFADDHRTAWLLSSQDSETVELRSLDTATGRQAVVAADPEADVAHVARHPRTGAIQAVAFEKDRAEWKVLDRSVAEDYDAIARAHDGDFYVVSRSLDDRRWVVAYDRDAGSTAFTLWDRDARRSAVLGVARPELEGLPLARMTPVRFPSRDGFTVHGYLTLPAGAPPRALPAVLLVHGGPWHRDSWGFDSQVQWLADRGYAVLQVNFRGSTGYGKRFLNAANREWGGRMQDDVTDAAGWLVAQGIADSKRLAIFGGSYGGYATLCGLTFTPDLFACGVAICGPSNLLSFIRTIPPYWAPMMSMFRHRVGDPDTEADFLKSRSPLFHIDRVKKPLLVVQGANDPRVVRAESVQMVEALKKAGKEVEYLEFPDEGHGFVRPENRLTMTRAAEAFLARHLGGR